MYLNFYNELAELENLIASCKNDPSSTFGTAKKNFQFTSYCKGENDEMKR